jgi:hypothetical protein
MPWRDSISRPIAPVSSVAGEGDSTKPRRLRNSETYCYSSKQPSFQSNMPAVRSKLCLSIRKPGRVVFGNALRDMYVGVR